MGPAAISVAELEKTSQKEFPTFSFAGAIFCYLLLWLCCGIGQIDLRQRATNNLSVFLRQGIVEYIVNGDTEAARQLANDVETTQNAINALQNEFLSEDDIRAMEARIHENPSAVLWSDATDWIAMGDYDPANDNYAMNLGLREAGPRRRPRPGAAESGNLDSDGNQGSMIHDLRDHV